MKLEIIPVHNSIIANQYQKWNNLIQGVIGVVVFIICSLVIGYVVVGFFTDPDPFYDNPKGEISAPVVINSYNP